MQQFKLHNLALTFCVSLIAFLTNIIPVIANNSNVGDNNNESVNILHVDSKIYGDWITSVYPYLGACGLNNETWWMATMSMSSEQIAEITAMMQNNTVYDNRSSLKFHYEPSQQNYFVGILSNEISLGEGQYDVSLEFDNDKVHSLTGVVSKEIYPEEGYFGETYNNIVGFPHKDFLRIIVPDLKRYRTLIVKVENNALPQISLIGFTKAYSEMQKCMGEAVTYELVDPF